MSRDGAGNYSNPYPDFVAGTVVSSAQVDANNSDIATALTQSIAVDGQSTVTANIPMFTYKFTGLGAGNAATDSLNLGQAQASAYTYQGTDSGAADAYVIALVPAISTQAAGLRVSFVAANASTGPSTLNAGGGADAIEYQGAALGGAEIAANATIVCEHDGAAWQMTSPSALLSSTVGDVVGPASATADSLAKYSGTTGKLLKDGAVIGADVQAYDVDTAKLDVIQTWTAIQSMTDAALTTPSLINGVIPVDDKLFIGEANSYLTQVTGTQNIVRLFSDDIDTVHFSGGTISGHSVNSFGDLVMGDDTVLKFDLSANTITPGGYDIYADIQGLCDFSTNGIATAGNFQYRITAGTTGEVTDLGSTSVVEYITTNTVPDGAGSVVTNGKFGVVVNKDQSSIYFVNRRGVTHTLSVLFKTSGGGMNK